jgi:protein TonB
MGLTFFLCNAFSQKKDSCSISTITFVEEKPIFNGNLKDFIQNHIKYPQKAEQDLLEGTVVIVYWIDSLGVTFDHKVIKGIRKDLDEEALRVTKLIKYERPAMQRGKPIKIRYTVPVEFKLKEAEDK